jgi:YD repeat-containing protein
VNQYTLIMDIMIAPNASGAASLLQISSLDNTDDGDLFWQGGNFGQGTDGYKGTSIFTAGEWHRMIASFDEAANPPVVTKFVDGVFQDDWTANQGLDNARRALKPTAILFGDGDQDERKEIWVNSIQIRAGAMTKEQMAALGGPSADGIPVLALAPTSAPVLSISRNGNQLTLSWDAAGYALETTSSLTSPSWGSVSGAANNTAIVTVGAGPQVYRLKK